MLCGAKNKVVLRSCLFLLRVFTLRDEGDKEIMSVTVDDCLLVLRCVGAVMIVLFFRTWRHLLFSLFSHHVLVAGGSDARLSPVVQKFVPESHNDNNF